MINHHVYVFEHYEVAYPFAVYWGVDFPKPWKEKA